MLKGRGWGRGSGVVVGLWGRLGGGCRWFSGQSSFHMSPVWESQRLTSCCCCSSQEPSDLLMRYQAGCPGQEGPGGSGRFRRVQAEGPGGSSLRVHEVEGGSGRSRLRLRVQGSPGGSRLRVQGVQGGSGRFRRVQSEGPGGSGRSRRVQAQAEGATAH